jgi:hypothetical protein
MGAAAYIGIPDAGWHAVPWRPLPGLRSDS